MNATDRSAIRQLDRALTFEWEDPCELFGHTLNMGTIDREGVAHDAPVRRPMSHIYNFDRREPLAVCPFPMTVPAECSI